jgi:hypothetical protein
MINIRKRFQDIQCQIRLPLVEWQNDSAVTMPSIHFQEYVNFRCLPKTFNEICTSRVLLWGEERQVAEQWLQLHWGREETNKPQPCHKPTKPYSLIAMYRSADSTFKDQSDVISAFLQHRISTVVDFLFRYQVVFLFLTKRKLNSLINIIERKKFLTVKSDEGNYVTHKRERKWKR